MFKINYFMLLVFLAAQIFLGEVAMANSQYDNTNVLGQPLAATNSTLATGFYRDGYCRTGPDDTGVHVVAAQVTAEFLAYTKSRGNDLSTPQPSYNFKGLKPGDKWCLCALRWREAEAAGVAPPVNLAATHKKALEFIELETLKRHQDN
jgi:hypothetical protein